ncbi:hypothetical protein PR001_g21800 [Phytophthora rubi]|uniref:DDE Tnp4 domain-containing protein n=1 Tax=Phytophthora rubi TaxID=129364 RepID=A0A6A3J6F5_9STRA|nr:hypothetical protein PR001_g21800 [Phytophthora rubi]
MSKVRVSVEWSYGEITQYFSYLDFKRQQQVATTPVATLYKLGILFTNCITIARAFFAPLVLPPVSGLSSDASVAASPLSLLRVTA